MSRMNGFGAVACSTKLVALPLIGILFFLCSVDLVTMTPVPFDKSALRLDVEAGDRSSLLYFRLGPFHSPRKIRSASWHEITWFCKMRWHQRNYGPPEKCSIDRRTPTKTKNLSVYETIRMNFDCNWFRTFSMNWLSKSSDHPNRSQRESSNNWSFSWMMSWFSDRCDGKITAEDKIEQYSIQNLF